MLPDIPADTIVSRTFYGDDGVKGILFGFAAGQELSEHTAARPAILHFLSGKAELTLGEETLTAGPGTWIHMAARLPHSVLAQTPVVMLLLMLP
jgi:quercetin dioxygenase-like cupin family protein